MKYLDKIHSPKDLKKIPVSELNEVCSELRHYIIDTINKIGGHLAPTLGTIELTQLYTTFLMLLKIKLCGIHDTKPMHIRF